MHRNIYNYDVAPGKSEEVEKILRDLSSRLKGNPGSLGCSITKYIEYGRDASHDVYAFMRDWLNKADLQTFTKNNAITTREYSNLSKQESSTSYEHLHEHEVEGTGVLSE